MDIIGYKSVRIISVTRYKGEELIEVADGVVISNTELNGESVSSVLFDNCQIQDEAVIRAVAKNPAGEDNCSATFIVQSECLTSMPAVSAVEYICCRFILSL